MNTGPYAKIESIPNMPGYFRIYCPVCGTDFTSTVDFSVPRHMEHLERVLNGSTGQEFDKPLLASCHHTYVIAHADALAASQGIDPSSE